MCVRVCQDEQHLGRSWLTPPQKKKLHLYFLIPTDGPLDGQTNIPLSRTTCSVEDYRYAVRSLFQTYKCLLEYNCLCKGATTLLTTYVHTKGHRLRGEWLRSAVDVLTEGKINFVAVAKAVAARRAAKILHSQKFLLHDSRHKFIQQGTITVKSFKAQSHGQGIMIAYLAHDMHIQHMFLVDWRL